MNKNEVIFEFLFNKPEYLEEMAVMLENELEESNKKDRLKKRIKSLRDILKENPFILLEIIDGVLVGTVSLLQEGLKEFPDFSPYIENVCIKPEYRKNGFGTILMIEALRRAKIMGFEKVYLDTTNSDSFFINHGWKLAKEIQNDNKKPLKIYYFDLRS